MAYQYQYNPGGGDNRELWSWLAVVAALVFFWPVGVFLLLRKLLGSDRRNRFSNHPYDVQQGQEVPPQAEGSRARQPKTESRSEAKSAPDGSYHYQYEYRYQSQAKTQSAYQGKPWQSAGASAYKGKAAPGMQGVNPRYRKMAGQNTGKALTVWGGILTGIFGMAAITAIPAILMSGDLAAIFGGGAPILGFLSLGVGLLYAGGQRRKRAKRFRKYLALIGKRESISVVSLAQAMPVSYAAACADLQDMLDEGWFPTGYLDMASGRLILSDEGLREEPIVAEEEPEEEEKPVDNDTFLHEIKQINDDIDDEEMSRKIDRIGEITAKILDYQRKNPGKAGQLHSFLGYYLPTTLKILRAYAQMENQGVEGENIRAAKGRIEGMMDKVVEGFEKQLDKLFQDDAMDITADVEVLERMLDKDGLSGQGDMFQMGG